VTCTWGTKVARSLALLPTPPIEIWRKVIREVPLQNHFPKSWRFPSNRSHQLDLQTFHVLEVPAPIRYRCGARRRTRSTSPSAAPSSTLRVSVVPKGIILVRTGMPTEPSTHNLCFLNESSSIHPTTILLELLYGRQSRVRCRRLR